MLPRTVAISADLRDSDAFSEAAVISSDGRQSLDVTLCLLNACQKCEMAKAAYLFHHPCWKLINRSTTDHTSLQLYRFARSTHPIFEDTEFEDERRKRRRMPLHFTSTLAEKSEETEIGGLLRCLSRLPPEIQFSISAECPRTLLSSLLIVSQTSTPLLSLIQHNGLDQSVVRINCDTNVHTVSSRSIELFGESYITLLGFNEHVENDSKDPNVIAVKRLKIKGIKFVLGCYGIRAVSILYADNSTSAWLGDPARGWNGVMYGDTLGSLRVIRDV